MADVTIDTEEKRLPDHPDGLRASES